MDSVSSGDGFERPAAEWQPLPRVTSVGTVTRWTGWDVRGGASADPSAAVAFAQSAPRDRARGAHYELIAVAARGFRPPKLLSTVDLAEGAASDPGREAEPDREGLRQVWSLLYRRITETGPPVVDPYAIYLLGVNPPVDTSDDDLEVFDDFYTNVHLPEVAERRHALRAVRYELVSEVRPPYRGAPRFLAVYEVDEESASNRRHAGPAYSSGPEVWQRHTTPWRLWYRRLVPGDGGGGAVPALT
jgi:hypothetical protein